MGDTNPSSIKNYLRLVEEDPSNFKKWHQLSKRLQNYEDKKQLLNHLNQKSFSNPDAEILRLTFLSDWTDQINLAGQASLIALQKDVPCIDQLASFAALYSIQAVSKSNKNEFISHLLTTRVPELLSKLRNLSNQFIPESLKPRFTNKIKKIVMIMPCIGGPMHTPTVLALNYLKILASLGFIVKVISALEIYPKDPFAYHGTSRCVNPIDINIPYLKKSLIGECSIDISTAKVSLEERFKKHLLSIAKFDPDVVFLIGNYSTLANILYSYRPSLILPTNSIIPLIPSDVVLSTQNSPSLNIQDNNQFSSPTLHYHPYKIFSPSVDKELTKPDMGIFEDATVLVTIGYRLHREITGQWLNSIISLIKQNPNLRWLIIGLEDRNLIPALTEIGSQVIVLGHQDNVGNILSLCDIYINPPRMGGGFSIIEAMALKKPVVSFSNSDGGAKVGEFSVATLNQYCDFLDNLIQNTDLREKIGAQLKKRFHELYDLNNSKSSLKDALILAQELGRKRFKDPYL